MLGMKRCGIWCGRGRRRQHLQSANPALPRRRRQAKGCLHGCHSPRDDWFNLGDCPDRTAATLGLIKSHLPTTGKGEPDASKSSGARRRRQDRGGEPSRPVMSRPKPTLASRSRQPRTKPRSCGIQPAHESLFNRRLRILSPAVRTSQLTPSAPADTDNRVRTLESEHESRVLKMPELLRRLARMESPSALS